MKNVVTRIKESVRCVYHRDVVFNKNRSIKIEYRFQDLYTFTIKCLINAKNAIGTAIYLLNFTPYDTREFKCYSSLNSHKFIYFEPEFFTIENNKSA